MYTSIEDTLSALVKQNEHHLRMKAVLDAAGFSGSLKLEELAKRIDYSETSIRRMMRPGKSPNWEDILRIAIAIQNDLPGDYDPQRISMWLMHGNEFCDVPFIGSMRKNCEAILKKLGLNTGKKLNDDVLVIPTDNLLQIAINNYLITYTQMINNNALMENGSRMVALIK